MTKAILLRGGPDDGRKENVDHTLHVFTVLRSIAPMKKMVLIGFERGFYNQTNEIQDGRQVFEWVGWEGEKN